MPVIDENRLIVTLGLKLLENTKRPGLRALIDAAMGARAESGRTPRKRKINSSFIGFTIAPRMNAAGRVSSASIAVELLLAEDSARAQTLAESLCDLNLTRQVEENRIAEQAYQKIEKTFDPASDRVIVIDDDTWQQGIIGIVSSRITEHYGLPSILISFDGTANGEPLGTDVGKGSGRSIKGMNLVEALINCEDLLVRFGGHELAAGLSITRANIDAFRRRINRYAADCFSEEALTISLDADCEVEMNELTMALAEQISTMEPFGVANAVPTFVLRDARIVKMIPMGAGKHTKLIIEKDGREMAALWFGMSASQLSFNVSDPIDLLFQLSINEYQGVLSLQMIVQDIHLSERFSSALRRDMARYEEICAGELYSEEENILPTRDDFALVYTALRREFRAGHTIFSMQRMMAFLPTQDGCSISYIKLKFIIRIMQELQICEITEPTEDCYVFGFPYHTTKTNIEKSSILKRLKSQLRKPEDSGR
jgi:single-stranded-DNA-specific exonuclease